MVFFASQCGVFMSSDAGSSWSDASTGLPPVDMQMRDNVAQNLAITADKKYLILGTPGFGVYWADLEKLGQ